MGTKLSAFIAIYALLLCAGCSTPQLTADRLMLERMMQGIVRISAYKDFNSPEETFAGTAFVIAKDPCILATAAHVSWDRNHLTTYRFNTSPGKTVPPQRSRRAFSDGASDVSFIHLDAAACRDADPYVFPLLDDPLGEIGLGDDVFILVIHF